MSVNRPLELGRRQLLAGAALPFLTLPTLPDKQLTKEKERKEVVKEPRYSKVKINPRRSLLLDTQGKLNYTLYERSYIEEDYKDDLIEIGLEKIIEAQLPNEIYFYEETEHNNLEIESLNIYELSTKGKKLLRNKITSLNLYESLEEPHFSKLEVIGFNKDEVEKIVVQMDFRGISCKKYEELYLNYRNYELKPTNSAEMSKRCIKVYEEFLARDTNLSIMEALAILSKG